MGTADLLLQESRRVDVLRVDRELGTQPACEIELRIVDIDCCYLEPHRLGVLHRHVAQAANAGNGDPLTRSGIGDLQALIDSDACAQHRRDLDEAHVVRQMTHIIGSSKGVFRKAAVDRITRVLLRLAQGFPATEAMLAMAAG